MAAERHERNINWLPLEANPEVMDEFMRPLGVSGGASFHDVYGFDEDLLAMVPHPVLAVLFLYPITPQTEAASQEEVESITKDGQHVSKNVFFIRQTVGNACGTIALLHSLGNNRKSVQLRSGSYLAMFFEKTSEMTADERAKYLEEDEELVKAHATAATGGHTRPPSAEEEVDLHFVAFVCVDGDVYELDGRKEFPINHGKSSSDSLLKDAVNIIQRFIKNSSHSHQFNVITLSGCDWKD